MEPTGGHDDDHGRGGRAGGRRRPSPAVYRRRRLAVTVLVLLAVIALIIGAIALAGALGRGSDASAGGSPTQDTTAAPASEGPAGATGPATAAPTTATPSAGPTASPAQSASAQPSASPDDVCDPDDVVVEAGTDRPSYGPDDTVLLYLVVRNEGDTACTANVGTSQMEFLVTSGDERVFSSIDCQQASQDLERSIEPGADQRAEFEWPRNRSMPGCTAVEEEPGAGPYTVTTKLGLRSSSPVDFTLQ